MDSSRIATKMVAYGWCPEKWLLYVWSGKRNISEEKVRKCHLPEHMGTLTPWMRKCSRIPSPVMWRLQWSWRWKWTVLFHRLLSFRSMDKLTSNPLSNNKILKQPLRIGETKICPSPLQVEYYVEYYITGLVLGGMVIHDEYVCYCSTMLLNTDFLRKRSTHKVITTGMWEGVVEGRGEILHTITNLNGICLSWQVHRCPYCFIGPSNYHRTTHCFNIFL